MGGREDGWFQSQEINQPPQPSLSIQLGLLMGTQGAWREQAAFPGRVRKCPELGPRRPAGSGGAPGGFLWLFPGVVSPAPPQQQDARRPQSQSGLHSSLSAQPLRPWPAVEGTRA